LIESLRKFGFEGDFNTWDSVVFIGFKGNKKTQSITKIIDNANDTNDQVIDLNIAEIYGKYNSAITLDSSLNNGDYTIKVRGIDILGNIGEVFEINYTINK